MLLTQAIEEIAFSIAGLKEEAGNLKDAIASTKSNDAFSYSDRINLQSDVKESLDSVERQMSQINSLEIRMGEIEKLLVTFADIKSTLDAVKSDRTLFDRITELQAEIVNIHDMINTSAKDANASSQSLSDNATGDASSLNAQTLYSLKKLAREDSDFRNKLIGAGITDAKTWIG